MGRTMRARSRWRAELRIPRVRVGHGDQASRPFFSRTGGQASRLFEIVGRLDASEVLIDDRPVPYARELWLPLVWFLIR